jgi:hypothetical protein
MLHLLNKLALTILWEAADSLRYFCFVVFLFVLCDNTCYEEEEYQDYPDP